MIATNLAFKCQIIILFSNFTLVVKNLSFKFLIINIGSLFGGLPKREPFNMMKLLFFKNPSF